MKLLLRYLLSFSLVGSIFIGGLYLGNSLVDSAIAQSSDPYTPLQAIARTLHLIENNYIEEVSSDSLVHSAIGGIANDLDEHSHYFSPKEYRSLKKDVDGWAVGIGVELNNEKVITNLATKGPASIAGLIVGDRLLKINGRSVTDWTLSSIQKAFKGEKGSSLTLVVQRNTKEIEVTVIRDDVKQVLVEVISIKPGYVYIRIEKFRDGITEILHKELRNIENVDEQPLDGIILDLRNNPGGTITEGVSLTDLFLDSGVITEIQMRVNTETEVFNATKNEEAFEKTKLVVIQNGKSASSAELVAGALQYHKRAVIVGEPSYGKGSIQQVYPFKEQGALKLTVGRYLLPDTQKVTPQNPILPDIQVTAAIPNSKTELQKSIQGLSISKEERKELLDLLSQLPAPKKRQAIPWHLDFSQRLTLDPQLAAAWRNLEDK